MEGAAEDSIPLYNGCICSVKKNFVPCFAAVQVEEREGKGGYKLKI